MNKNYKNILKLLKNILRIPSARTKINRKEPAVKGHRFFFHFPLNEQVLLFKRLAILLKAGIPIFLALESMKKQLSSKAALTLLEDLTRGVADGQFIHTVLEKYKRPLGEFTVNIVRIGEISGTLDENLSYLTTELKKKRELRRKVLSTLIYPAFVVTSTIGIVVLLMVYVFPKILPILQNFRGELPIPTKILIASSSILVHQGWFIAIILFLAIIGVGLLRRLYAVRFFFDSMLFKIPIFGKLFQYYYIVNFCRTLGLLLKSNIHIVEATLITAKTSNNLVYRASLTRLSEVINRGGKISEYLEEEEKLYPAMVTQMITVGEVTSNLSDSLIYLAEVYENEVDELTKNLSSSIEPLLMIFMGFLVGFVALSIITPIYQLTQNLHP